MASLATELNEKNVIADIEKGKVTLHQFDATSRKTKPIKIKGKGYVDAHPEGSDRGGYVAFWKRGKELAFFMEMDGEWQDDDD